MSQRAFRGLLVLAALLASILYLWKPWSTDGRPALNLGLDLQGGILLAMGVDVDRAVKAAQRAYDDAAYPETEKQAQAALAAGLVSARDRAAAHKLLAFVFCSSGPRCRPTRPSPSAAARPATRCGARSGSA